MAMPSQYKLAIGSFSKGTGAIIFSVISHVSCVSNTQFKDISVALVFAMQSSTAQLNPEEAETNVV